MSQKKNQKIDQVIRLANGQEVDITWQRSQRNKHLRLTVSAHGIRVSSPKRTSWSQVENFLNQQKPWLQAHLNQHDHLTDNQILFQGQTLTIKPGTGNKRVHIQQDQLFINPVRPDNHSAQQTLERWLRTQAADQITPIFIEQRKIMNIPAPILQWKETKSRWGSCSTSGQIMLNWRLIHTPIEVARYVVIHELAHREHPNHSQQFWKFVEKFDPAYRRHRGWLKRHGHRCQTPLITIFS